MDVGYNVIDMTNLHQAWRHFPSVRDLIVLVAVAERGGVSAAARTLGLAQPNVSRSLRRLEGDLRTELLTRSTRGTALTPAGTVVVDWARRVLEANHQLVAGARALAQSDAPLKIAASHTIAEDLLPRWLAALRAENPDVAVMLTVANSDEVGRLVSQGGVLGFLESPRLPHTLDVPSESRTVATDRLVVVVSPGHEWARRTRPVTRAELAATALVVREPGSGTRVSYEEAMSEFILATPTLELTGNAAVRVAVAAGAGPAVLSELAVQAAVASGELQAVMVEGLSVERPLRAVWATTPAPSSDVLRMVELAETSGRTAL